MLKKLAQFALLLALLLTAAIAVLSGWPLAEPLPQKQAATPGFLIKNIQLVDVQAGRILAGKSLVIRAGRIREILDQAPPTLAENVTVIDGGGRYVIPGLWDMHNHFAFQTAPQMSMPLYIAAGVTHVREMQGIVNINEERRAWKAQIEAGRLLGPKIVAYADEMVGGNYDEQDLDSLVRRSAESPDTFIKVYSAVMPQRFLTLAGLAKEQGVVIAGHYPNSVNPIDAANAGQKSFEHGLLFLNHAYAGADDLRQQYRAYYAGQGSLERPLEQRNRVFSDFDPARFEALVAAMLSNGTYFCPTHITRRFEALAHDEAFRADERLKYIPPMVNMVWQDDADSEAAWEGEAGKDHLMQVYLRGLELTGMAHEKGVKVLAGSDSLDPYSFPGLSLHDELSELVKAGLSPAAALRAATMTAAEYFSLEADYGSVAPGKLADLVFLNSNPLEDIGNTRDIRAVFFNGAYYSESDLQGMLDYVEQSNSGIRGVILSLKMFWRLMRDNRH